MQSVDNVVLFPKLTRHLADNKSISRTTGAGIQQPSHNRRESEFMKGALAMPRTSAAIRVIRTTKSHVKAKRPRSAATVKPAGLSEGSELRNEKFKTLARKRVPRVLRELKLIENLASHNYKYTPEQAQKIITTLENGLQQVRDAFNKPKRVEQVPPFDL